VTGRRQGQGRCPWTLQGAVRPLDPTTRERLLREGGQEMLQHHLAPLSQQPRLSNGFQGPLGPWRVQGRALAFDRAGMAAQRRGQNGAAGHRPQRLGEQDAAHRHVRYAPPRRAASAITARSSASTAAGFSSGIIRRSRRKTTRSGTTLVLIPPSISPIVNLGRADAGNGGDARRQAITPAIQRGEDSGSPRPAHRPR
jgi:hypothetical protein